MGIRIVTAPALEPITLAQAKAQCEIDSSVTRFDDLLALHIAAARDAAEQRMGAVIMQRTVDHTLDRFPRADEADVQIGMVPAWNERVPVAAPVTVSSIQYVDTDGTLQALDSSAYTLDDSNWPLWILPAFDTDWPDTREQANAVTIRLQVGYVSEAQVPGGVRSWLLLATAYLFAQREMFDLTGKVGQIPGGFAQSLLDPYWVPSA